jgi:hypothetical protein
MSPTLYDSVDFFIYIFMNQNPVSLTIKRLKFLTAKRKLMLQIFF